jgi:hypothetical protein
MKRILIALIVCMTLAVFVSCDGNKAVEDQGLAQVTMSVESKALVASVNDGINSYQFRATPNFSYGSDETIYGTVDEYREITLSGGTASLGYYSQGSWTFEVRALAENDVVIASGSTTVFLKAGAENTVAITISNDAGTGDTHGSVHFIIETGDLGNELDIEVISQLVTAADELGDAVEYEGITWTKYTYEDLSDATNNEIFSNDPDNPTWEAGNYPEWYRNGVRYPLGRLLYVADIPEVPSGSYIFTVRISNRSTNYMVAGQMIAVRVIDDTTTNITGTMLSGDFVAGALTITAPGTIAGTINGETVLATSRDTSIELTWTGEEDADTPVAYQWMVDGIVIDDETEESYVYTPALYGRHIVSVIAFGDDNGQIGSATVKVNVLPTAGTQPNN